MEFNLVHRERWISFFVFALHTHVHIQSSKSNNNGAPAITIVKSNDQKHFVIYVEINEQIMYIWGNTTKNCIKSNPQSHFENLRCVAYGGMHSVHFSSSQYVCEYRAAQHMPRTTAAATNSMEGNVNATASANVFR